MPLDHYVSQTHLKKFYDPILGHKMHGYKKSDGKRFPCDSKSQCRTPNGSSNPYLLEERAVEYVLKEIEPKYNIGLLQARTRSFDVDGVLGIAGFAAYVSSCSPAAMRLGQVPLRMMLEATAAEVERRGLLPPLPSELKGPSLMEALETGELQFKVDPKYPQAMGIQGLLVRVSRWGNCKWDVIFNQFDDTPFFTSDFPVAIQPSHDPRVVDRYVPLAPDLAIRIRPDLSRRERVPDLTFRELKVRFVDASRSEVVDINRQIVRSAEEYVYYRSELPWVGPFLQKNSNYRVEVEEMSFDTGGGTFVLPRMAIARRDA